MEAGSVELTVERLREQQESTTEQQADVTAKLGERLTALERGEAPPLARTEAPEPAEARVKSVLWVDDRPSNNTYLIELLRSRSVDVQVALSTADGLRLLDSQTPDAIVSDLGREENGVWKPHGGLEFATRVRALDGAIPIFLFTRRKHVLQVGDKALAMGVTGIT